MLEGKVALVTGAGRGIGATIAETLAREGAFVVVNYRGSGQAAQELAEKIGGAAMQGDVADFEACENMIKTMIETYGHLDILVNNAGITRDGLLMKMSEADFEAVLSTNLKGTFHTIRHASRYFLKQRYGRIVNISSVSGDGECRAGKLQCKQGRGDRTDEKCGKGTGVAGDHLQCGGTRFYRDGYDRCHDRERKGSRSKTDSAGEMRKYKGCGRTCDISGIRQGRVYHRSGDLGGWRHVYVRE